MKVLPIRKDWQRHTPERELARADTRARIAAHREGQRIWLERRGVQSDWASWLTRPALHR